MGLLHINWVPLSNNAPQKQNKLVAPFYYSQIKFFITFFLTISSLLSMNLLNQRPYERNEPPKVTAQFHYQHTPWHSRFDLPEVDS